MSATREKFEEWADDKGFCLDCKFFEDGNNYEDADTRLAFDIWQASRAALVVELPETVRVYEWHDFMREYEVREAIQSAGITVKP